MSMQPIVVAGWRSSVIHTDHRRYPVQAGEPVFMEMGAAWHRYTAPMMRTVVAEDMVFHLPLCLRVPGPWGIGCSETVRVGWGGAEPITRHDWAFGQP